MAQRSSLTAPGKRSPFVIYLQQLLARTGMDLTELARRSKLTRVTVSRHVNGHAFPHYGNRKRYAGAFGMKIDEFESGWRQPAIAGAALLDLPARGGGSAKGTGRVAGPESVAGWGQSTGSSRRKSQSHTAASLTEHRAHAVFSGLKPIGAEPQQPGIPLLGEVAASGFVESLVFDLAEPERLPIAYPGLQRVYALRIRGDSMTPVYQPGEILILQDIPPEEIIDSEDAVVQCDGSFDGQSTFKRVLVMGSRRLRLMPLNSRYESLECNWESVVRVGRVLGKFTPIKQIRGLP